MKEHFCMLATFPFTILLIFAENEVYSQSTLHNSINILRARLDKHLIRRCSICVRQGIPRHRATQLFKLLLKERDTTLPNNLFFFLPSLPPSFLSFFPSTPPSPPIKITEGLTFARIAMCSARIRSRELSGCTWSAAQNPPGHVER